MEKSRMASWEVAIFVLMTTLVATETCLEVHKCELLLELSQPEYNLKFDQIPMWACLANAGLILNSKKGVGMYPFKGVFRISVDWWYECPCLNMTHIPLVGPLNLTYDVTCALRVYDHYYTGLHYSGFKGWGSVYDDYCKDVPNVWESFYNFCRNYTSTSGKFPKGFYRDQTNNHDVSEYDEDYTSS